MADRQLTIPSRRRPLVILPRARRVEQVAEIDQRLGRKALNREVAAELGVSLSYASGLRTDPTGEIDRQRKRSYYRSCEDCGQPCYSSGPNGASQSRRCVECTTGAPAPERSGRIRGWSKDDLLDILVARALELGRPPRQTDFYPAIPGVRPSWGPYQRVWPNGINGALAELAASSRLPAELTTPTIGGSRLRWHKPDLLDAIVAFALELGRLPRTNDFSPVVPGVRPSTGPYYRVWPTNGGRRRRWNESWILNPDTAGGPTGALVEAVRQDRIPVEMLLNEPNQTRRSLLTEAYGFDRLVHRAGELLDESDYGKLWRLDIAADRRAAIVDLAHDRVRVDIDRRLRRNLDSDREAMLEREIRRLEQLNNLPEPVLMVEVVNSTAEPDGTFKDYWLRVPPTITTAREAVAWTFDVPADEYRVAIET